MRKITEQELKEILEKHEKWLRDEEGGERADLSNVDLSYVNLEGVDLSNANLSNANLSNVDLSYAKLEGANLSNANLSNVDLPYANLSNVGLYNANLSNANLSNTDLYNANLSNANLSYAKLSNADLEGANLSNVNLYNASLSNANLSNANLDKSEQCRFGIILQEPRMAYKKCDKYIVQLLIPKGAIVFSINNKNRRTNKATPIAILDLEGKITNRKKIASDYDNTFEYKLMESIKIQDFNLMYNVECTTGIHFFWDFERAKNYC